MKKLFILTLLFAFLLNINQSDAGRWRRLISAATFECWANPKNPNTLFVGGEGRKVYRSYDAGETWDTLIISYVHGPAILNNVVVPENDTNVVMVGGISFGDVRRSTNQGNDWSIALQEEFVPITLNGKAIAIKNDDPDVMFIGNFNTGVIYKSTDRGATWDSLTTVMKHEMTEDENGNPKDTMVHVPIASLGIRPDSSNIMFTNSTDSRIYVSTDSGEHWRFTDSLIVPEVYKGDCEITRMTFNGKNPMHGYAVITYIFAGNLPNGGLYKTTDGGYHWDLLALPDTSMWAVSVREHEGDDEVTIGGYSEDYYVHTIFRVPGNGIVATSKDAGETWTYYNDIDWNIERPYLNSPFNQLFMINEEHGFCAGGFGGMFFTNSNGYNWYNATPGTSTDNYSVWFITDSIGFVSSENGLIRKSTDQGQTWEDLSSGVNDDLYDIVFTDDAGFAFGENGVIVKTSNEGSSWEKIESPINDDLISAAFGSNEKAIVISRNDVIRSSDGGNTWIDTKFSGTERLNAIDALNDTTYIIVADEGKILKTTDQGDNWQLKNSGTLRDLNDVFALDEDNIYACGDTGTVILSGNGGNLWVKSETYGIRNLNSIWFTDKDNGIVAGDQRLLIKTIDGGNEWTLVHRGYGPRNNVWSLRYWGEKGHEKLYLATEAGLFVMDNPDPVIQPFSDGRDFFVYKSSENNLKIKYKLKTEFSRYLQFTITDLLGKTIIDQEIKNTARDVLTHDIRINNLAHGVYICTIRENGKMSVFKLILD